MRPLKPGDLDWVVELEQAAMKSPWNKALFASELEREDSVCLAGLARERGKEEPAAFAFSRILMNEMHLLRLAVAPRFRGRGLGRLLTRKSLAKAAAKGADTAWLEVRESNTAAQAMYRAEGFDRVGTRRSYYHDTREDAVIMFRRI
ncbi:MAG: ribosomal protein S18-alanine N-acetyltransferase [Deltaproteobacteria bacterium]|nr:ribosomal protein S18-alanine N-acetyltransferase [Deltaproteobacteria bacterium]